MIDSCSPRKLEPGFEQIYSTRSDLITSTMKSAPGRSVVWISTLEGGCVSASIALALGGVAAARRVLSSWAARFCGFATIAAAPAAAPFRNPRRPTGNFLDFIVFILAGP